MNREQELEMIAQFIQEEGVTLCQKDPAFCSRNMSQAVRAAGKGISRNPEGVRIRRVLAVKSKGRTQVNGPVWMESGRHPSHTDFAENMGATPPSPIHV